MANVKREPQRNEALRLAREERGWTQKTLAEKIGVAEQTISSWERHLRSPSLQLRALLTEVLGKTIEELDLLDPPQEVITELLREHDGETDQEKDHRLRSDDQYNPESAVEIPQVPEQEHNFLQNPQFLNVGGEEETALEKRSLRVKTSVHGDENRQHMLKRIEFHWISSILQPISNTSLIKLTLQMRSDAVVRPWGARIPVPYSDSTGRLPVDTKIIDVYDEADEGLLILGEPGAGKTILLLELTQELIERAYREASRPLPIVFLLSSWADKQLTLEEWLIQELNIKYLVPLSVARTWMRDDAICPLLDGLDEVSQPYRASCIKAINRYRQEHGFVPMVITSRSSDYDALPTKLTLTSAVVVKPLSLQQIDEYISQGGKNLAAIRLALQTDPLLQEMASTPLMISILALAYQGLSIEEMLAHHNQEERRRMVFEQYVQRALERKAQNVYSLQETIQSMSWLALQMQKHHQSAFYFERLQPDWLENDTEVRYRTMMIRLIFGLNILIDAGLFACFRGDSEPGLPGLFYWLGGHGFGNSILGWMSPGLGGGLKGGTSLAMMIFLAEITIVLIAGRDRFIQKPKEAVYQLLRGFIRALPLGILFGLLVAVGSGVLFTTLHGLSDGLIRGGGTGLFEGILVWLMVGLIGGLKSEKEDAGRDNGERSWFRRYLQFRSLQDRLINCVYFMICAMVGMVSIYSLQAQTMQPNFLLAGALLGMGIGAVFGLGNATELMPDLGVVIKPAETVAWSWKNVRDQSGMTLKAGLLLASAVALPTIASLYIASSTFYGTTYGWRYGLIYGSIVGLVNGVAAFLAGVLRAGWSSDLLSENQHQSMQPNQGIRNSLKHALFSASLFGPVGGIVGGLCCGLCFWLTDVPGWFTLILGFTLIYSIIFSLRFWSAYGGLAFIEHTVLHWYLARAGVLPRKGIAFLNYATECSLLYKVGGGYIFAHRLLLEYFARLSDR